MSDQDPEIGLIGGSGLYDLAGLTAPREVRVATPFGVPSDTIRLGRVGEFASDCFGPMLAMGL